MAKLADNLITFALILLGLVVMVTPLALWVAWTRTGLIAVLVACVSAGALYCILVHFEKPAAPRSGRRGGDLGHKRWTEQTMVELQKLHPFIHHHQPSGGPAFRRAMHRLKRHLYRPQG